jgi:hypothetical protein
MLRSKMIKLQWNCLTLTMYNKRYKSLCTFNIYNIYSQFSQFQNVVYHSITMTNSTYFSITMTRLDILFDYDDQTPTYFSINDYKTPTYFSINDYKTPTYFPINDYKTWNRLNYNTKKLTRLSLSQSTI